MNRWQISGNVKRTPGHVLGDIRRHRIGSALLVATLSRGACLFADDGAGYAAGNAHVAPISEICKHGEPPPLGALKLFGFV